MPQPITQLYFMYEKSTGRVFYVGITKRSLKARLAQHITDAKSNKYQHYQANKIRFMLNADIEFGIENLLTFDSRENAIIAEKKYISWCKQMGFVLTNGTEGGDGGLGHKHSDATKQRLRELNTGSNNPQFGKSPSQETRAKQSQTLKGVPNPGLVPPEKKAQWRANVKANHANVSGMRNPMFGTTGVHNAKSKPVIQFTLDDIEIARFAGVREAERNTQVASAHISLCCNGKKINAGGFKWQFALP